MKDESNHKVKSIIIKFLPIEKRLSYRNQSLSYSPCIAAYPSLDASKSFISK